MIPESVTIAELRARRSQSETLFGFALGQWFFKNNYHKKLILWENLPRVSALWSKFPSKDSPRMVNSYKRSSITLKGRFQFSGFRNLTWVFEISRCTSNSLKCSGWAGKFCCSTSRVYLSDCFDRILLSVRISKMFQSKIWFDNTPPYCHFFPRIETWALRNAINFCI